MKFTYEDSARKKASVKPTWPPDDCRLPDNSTLAILAGDGDPERDLFAFFDKSLREAAENAEKSRRAKGMKLLHMQITTAVDPLKRPRLAKPGDYWAPPELDRIYQ